MTATRRPALRRPPTWTTARRIEHGVLWLAAAALVAGAVATLIDPERFGVPTLLEDPGSFAAGVAIYAFSHVLRFVRLALLIPHPGMRMRRVLQVHVFTSGLGIMLPFKLGDVVRAREVGVLAGSFRSGLLAVWLERTLDAVVLLGLVILTAVAVPDALSTLTPILVAMSAFVGATVVLITVVPQNIREAMLMLARRRYGERSVTALRIMRAGLGTLQIAPRVLRGRVPTLLLLSLLIWTAEIAVVSVTIPGVDLEFSQLSTAMLSVLSGLASGAPAIVPAAGDRLVETLTDLGAPADVDVYRLTLIVPLLVASAAAAAVYLPKRRPGAR